MRRLLFAILPALLLIAGCGYTLGPHKPKAYKDIKTVAVLNFKNRTLEPRLEVLFANALIRHLQEDGTYKIVSEKDADAIFEGEINLIDRRPARSVIGDVLLAREYTLTIRGKYKFYHRKDSAPLDSRIMLGATSFFVSGSSPISADVNEDERQAIALAAEDMATRLTSQLTEGF
jgi:hypothetical protein